MPRITHDSRWFSSIEIRKSTLTTFYIAEACKELKVEPKITLIVVGKRHHNQYAPFWQSWNECVLTGFLAGYFRRTPRMQTEARMPLLAPWWIRISPTPQTLTSSFYRMPESKALAVAVITQYYMMYVFRTFNSCGFLLTTFSTFTGEYFYVSMPAWFYLLSI